MTKLFHKNDIYLIIGLIIVLCVIGAVYLFTRKNGAMVRVSVDGITTATYPLEKEMTTVIDGYDGGQNTLVIEDGSAYLKDTTCPDHLCEKMGKINSAGQSVICLPNRVIVEIIGDDTTPKYDTVVGG